MTGAELLVRNLVKNDIKRVYGILGREAEVLQFNEGDQIMDFFLTHHENTAGMMACCVARCTKKPQVCFVTLGPGITHIMTSVAMANVDRNPVLFIAAQVEREDINYNNVHQCLDGCSIVSSVTKYCREISEASELNNVICEAIGTMMQPPYGPAFISVPIDILRNDVLVECETSGKKCVNCKSNSLESVKESQISEVVRKIKKSKRPIIIVGDAVGKYENDSGSILMFAEKHQIPIFSTYAAAGQIPYHHELNYGLLNSYEKHFLNTNIWKLAFEDADLILLFGYDPVEHHPRTWKHGESKTVISLLPYHLNLSYKNTRELINLTGNIESTVLEIDEKLGEIIFEFDKGKIREIVKLRERFNNKHYENQITIGEIYKGLKKILGKKLVVVNDVGLNRHLNAVAMEAEEPNDFITSAGLSSFGSGLAMGMGAKIALDEKEIVVLAGDGGFLSSCCDIETIMRRKLKLLMIVYNSTAYSLIERYLKSNDRAKNNPEITQFYEVDFSQIARAMGCEGIKVNSIEELEAAIEIYKNSNESMLIEINAYYPKLYLKGKH